MNHTIKTKEERLSLYKKIAESPNKEKEQLNSIWQDIIFDVDTANFLVNLYDDIEDKTTNGKIKKQNKTTID